MFAPDRVVSGPPVVFVTRGERVESVHRIAACASDSRGALALAYGDVDVPVYLRSAAKPFIAAEIVASGAADRYGFDERELAVIAASHNAEPFHVDAVRAILAKIGLGEDALQCGAHPPNDDASAAALVAAGRKPTPIHNNCSGKHAGILALCLQTGAPIETYLDAANPAQRAILAFCGRMCDDDPATWPVGVDGCGIPVFATPLRKAALAFARFATFDGMNERDAAALARVRAAMVAFPEYVAGTGRFDTALMRAARGAIACKAGAEGVHGSAAIAQGLGHVAKVVDGTRRAAPPAVIGNLTALGVLNAAAREELAPLARPDVYNVAGRTVGHVEARLPDTIRPPRT